jgi:hypothetical protein
MRHVQISGAARRLRAFARPELTSIISSDYNNRRTVIFGAGLFASFGVLPAL